MVDKPEASSTPKQLKGRRPIREYPGELVSPIENQKNTPKDASNDKVPRMDAGEYFSSESEDDEQVDSTEEDRENIEPNLSKTECPGSGNIFYRLFIYMGILAFLIGLYFYPQAETVNVVHSDFVSLMNDHPQTDDFWINVRVALHDIKRLNQPKSIIFLYEDDPTMTRVLKSISRYASYDICRTGQVIQLPGKHLKNKEILNDYGTFISEIRDNLAEKCVVIITNLDEVPGISAQAFHSLCDEYNPVKNQVLFLFTVKVNSFANVNEKYIEKLLLEKWNELHMDKFYPLYARISSFVVKVNTEK